MTVFLGKIGKAAFGPLDRRTIWHWAEQHIQLRGAYSITGQFQSSRSPFVRDWFDAIKSNRVRVTHIRAPVRIGKSMVLDICLAWIPVNDPGPCMVNFTTDEVAKDHAKTRIRQNFQGCAEVRRLFPDNRHDLNQQEIIFRNGMPMFIQGPSMAHLQSKAVRWLFNDDVFDWEQGRLAQALARVGDFEELGISHVVNLSQGGEEGDDEDLEFRKGVVFEWRVPCLGKCGSFFDPVLEFNRVDSAGKPYGFAFDISENGIDSAGDWMIEKIKHSISFICPSCGFEHRDSRETRSRWNAGGYFYSEALKEKFQIQSAPERISFHLEASVSRWWYHLLEEYLNAMNALRKGVVDPFKIFWQKRRALSWSELALFSAKPFRGFEHKAEDWDQEAIRFFTLDVQEDCFWGVICAWSKQGEGRRLWFGRLLSEAEIMAKAAEYKIKAAHVGLDCGYREKGVYAMCVRHGWLAFRGDPKEEFARREIINGRHIIYRASWDYFQKDPEIGQVFGGRRFALVVRWSNPTIKDRLQQIIDRERFTVPVPPPNAELELEWKRQMASEYKRRIRNRITGQMRMEWICPSGNNHLRDCMLEQVVYITIKRLIPDIEEVPKEEQRESAV